MAFDPEMQRRIMGLFATGVTVVTTRLGEEVNGMTANAVVSLSLDPPLLLVAVDRQGSMYQSLKQSDCFAVSILARNQEHLSRRFAEVGPKDFSGLELEEAATGAPILAGALAFADCRLVEVLVGGDHDIFIGELVAGELGSGEPLIFYGGEYVRLATPQGKKS
jgi:flavin reductase (DIM6/NTAB) family NADH-FMN oxidoreductase RutF